MFIDWLEFTFKVEPTEQLDVWDQFLHEYPMFENLIDECVLGDRGMNGYTFVLRYCDEYIIQYNPDHASRMGVHVIFPGHGMWRMCELFGISGDDKPDFVSVKPVLEYISSHHGKITRIDIAYDDFTKKYKPIDYDRWFVFGRISSRCRTSARNSSEMYKGDTFYLGRRGRERYLRVYDKNYESGGLINSIRYEIEFRDDYLDKLVQNVLNGVHFDMADLILDLFTVVNEYEFSDNESTNSMRKMRAGIFQEWLEFVDSMRNSSLKLSSEPDLKVCRVKRVPSFGRTYDWIAERIIKRLFIFADAYGYDRFEDLIKSQRKRLKPLEEKMLNKYKSEVDDFFYGDGLDH